MSVVAWRVLAVIFLGLGLIGFALPLVPQIPFLLLGAAAAAKGWPWLDRRLLAHPVYGPLITGWRERRAIPARAKVFATLSLATTTLALFVLPVSVWWRVGWIAIAAATTLWLWHRPDR